MKTIILLIILTASVYSQSWKTLPGNTDAIINYDEYSIANVDSFIKVNLQYPASFETQTFYQTVSIYKDRTYKITYAYFINNVTGDKKEVQSNDKVYLIEPSTSLEYLYNIIYP